MPGLELQSFDVAGATPALLVLVKVTAVLLLALVLTTLMQRSSATARHLVWVATLTALVGIPLMGVWTPVHLAVLPASWRAAPAHGESAARPSSLAIPSVAMGSAMGSDTMVSTAPMVSDPMVVATMGSDTMATMATPLREPLRLTMVGVVATVWGAVALALLGWLASGALGVRRIVRSATTLDDAAWQSMLIDTADRLQLPTVPRLLASRRVTMPFAAGLRQPTIVLPSDCISWTSQRRAAVLLHELAHIRRRDIVAHTLGRLVCAAYWFHPLAWTAARRMRAESERACDDLAITCGTRASDYAEHLLEIVTSVRTHGTPSMAMAMATRSEFEGRMLAILDPTLTRTSPTRVQASTLAGGVMMFAIVAGAATPKVAAPDGASASQRAASLASVDPDGEMPGARIGVAASQDTDTLMRTDRPAITTDPVRTDDANALDGEERPESLAEGRAEASAEARADVRFNAQRSYDTNGDSRSSGTLSADRIKRFVASLDDSATRATVLARVLRTDTSAALRRTAAWGLNDHTGNTAAVDALLYALRRDASTDVREMAAWSLSDAADQQDVASALADALRSERDRTVRATLAWSIGEGASSRSADAIAALTTLLSDDDERLRELAVWGIGNMEPRTAPQAVIAALRDESPRIRATAAWALYQIEDGEAAGALEAALQRETGRDAKWSMVRALSVMGERAVAPLQRLIEGSDAQLRTLAIRSLAGAGGDPWPQPRPRPRPYP